MGNCLEVQGQVVRVMTIDGRVLEYRSPIRVYEVLSKFRDHAMSNTLPASKYMQANAELVRGCVYHLIPLQKESPKPRKKKKKVRFSIPEEGEEGKPSLRVKLVISKQKLREMIQTGVLPVDGMVTKNETGGVNFDCFNSCQRGTVWKPAYYESHI